MKKLLIILFILLMPLNIYAFSSKIIVGGETIGIEAYSKGVYVVGFYKVNGKEKAKIAGFKVGDLIEKINNFEINSISSFNEAIVESGEYNFYVKRGEKDITIKYLIEEEDNLLKTGLYLKDQINGIGTLSYIDPETKVFGALGHEIIENSSMNKFNLNNGKIYKAEVFSITKSQIGNPGEKNAKIDKSYETGNIYTNDLRGIFGSYTDTFKLNELVEVGKKEDIKKGEAIIKTVIKDNLKEEFLINIKAIDEASFNKNILFEIKDEKLLSKTGGVVQGMSGSPILQNDKIIGVVNYVIVDEAKTGYGIFITNMLEEGDKINS